MMTTFQYSPGGENTYVIRADDAAEIARLMKQDRLVNEHMGTLLPARLDEPAALHQVLDVACGPGGWALAVAYRYPDVQVSAIDLDAAVIEYARAQAWARGLENVNFIEMDARGPLHFPDDALDFVHARFLAAMMPASAWPGFLQECQRITRPGGLICLIESESCITNSPAFERFNALFCQALRAGGYAFSPDGRSIGITHMLGYLLRAVGWCEIQRKAYALDFSSGSEAHFDFYQNIMVAGKLLLPFLCKHHALSREALDRLYQQMLVELLQEDFCGIWYYLSVSGLKAQS